MMSLFGNYLYIEYYKLIRSKFFILNLVLFFILIGVILYGFRESVYSNYQIHLINFADTTFTDFFLTNLSSKLHLSIYILTLALTIQNMELDIKSKFFTNRRLLPLKMHLFLLSKICIIFVCILFISGIIHILIPFFIKNYFQEKKLLFEKTYTGLSLLYHFLLQLLAILPIIVALIAFTILFRLNILLVFLIFIILFFVGKLASLFYPFSAFNLIDLSKNLKIGISEIAVCLISSLFFYLLSYFKCKN